MNDVMKAILGRRSIRKFSGKAIPESVLADLVDAALHAPSGMGRKTWKFTVITDKSAINELVKAISVQLGRTGYDMYAPTALIIPSNLKDSPFGKEDNACALQNIFLAAESYGVGSVWINQLQGICDTEVIRPVLNKFGIPENHVVYGLAALGYADETLPKPAYKNGGDVHYIK